MAEALYRKYRPQVFEDVVGQEHIERTIKNAIDQDKVSHAYLFCGPRGTGKTTTARLLAKALLCEQGLTSTPDGTCTDCKLIAAGEHPDVYELDAASRTGVENVREEIIGRVRFAPTRGRYKIYIIDEVHMLSTAAFNALLKTLEEPPDHVVFILATTDPQKVPETIHSRCQRFDFRRISTEAIVSRLGAICIEEGVEFEGDALELIAHRAEGGMRNALTSLEQLIAFGEGSVTLDVAERMLGSLDTNDLAEIVRFVGMRDIASCFRWTAAYVETGADLAQFTRDFAEHMRNMYVLSLAAEDADAVLDVSDAQRRELVSELSLFGSDRLARLLGVLGDLTSELKTSTNPRLSFEIALTRMVRPDSDLTLEALAERVEALESGYSAVAFVSPASDASSAPAPAAATAAEDTCAEQGSTSVSEPASFPPDNPSSAQLPQNLADPSALQRAWQATLSNLKKNKAGYGALFQNATVAYDDEAQTLVVQFPPQNDFAFTSAQKPNAKAELSAALVQSYGTEIPFRVEKADSSGQNGGKVQTQVPTENRTTSVDVTHEPTRASDMQSQRTQQPSQQASRSTEEAQFQQTASEQTPPSQQTSEQEPEILQEPSSADESPQESALSESEPDEEVPAVGQSTDADDPSTDELASALAFGFGEGTSFSEDAEL